MGNYLIPFKRKPESYLIVDNGGRPHKVVCDGNTVSVHEIDQKTTNDTNVWSYKTDPILTYHPQKVFVGKSHKTEMTEFSGGYGPRWDGNSILLHMGSNKYIHISRKISAFDSIGNITSYVSLVGNSQFIYSYAIDEYNNYYLLQQNVILKNPNLDGYDQPYRYYFDYSLLTDNHGYIPPKKCKKIFRDIMTLYCNGERSTLHYNPFPEHINTHWFEHKDSMYVINTNGDKIEYTWADHLSLMNHVADTYNFVPLKMDIIVDQK